jgi:NAD(P)H dehydrogenase (quinone)
MRPGIMIVSLILAHPRPGSFNHAIAEAARDVLQQKGHQVAFHDLYSEGFDPVLPFEEIPRGAALDGAIERHCHEIASAEGIVIVHPNWWGMPPAILKGWVDRVLRPGMAYEFLEGDSGEGVPRGLLRAKTALVFNTSNTHRDRELSVFGDPLEKLWKSCIFDLCGVKEFYRTTHCVVVTSTPRERNLWLEEVRATVERYFPMEA